VDGVLDKSTPCRPVYAAVTNFLMFESVCVRFAFAESSFANLSASLVVMVIVLEFTMMFTLPTLLCVVSVLITGASSKSIFLMKLDGVRALLRRLMKF